VHDALSAERLGVPAVAIVTAPFVASATEIARIEGLPGYRVVSIPHPIAGEADDVLHARALLVAEALLPLLTAPERAR
jgi:hypothetical protein